MATILEIGLISYFQVIFPVLIVFAIIFAVLQKTKLIGENVAINGLIAIVAGLLTLLSKTVIGMINFMTPWFVVMILFFVLLLLIFRVFGATEENIATAVKDKAVYWALIGVCIIIFLAAFGFTVGQGLTEKSFEGGQEASYNVSAGTATKSFAGNLTGIFFNTQVLGLLLILAIAVFAIAFLSVKPD